VRSAIYKTWGHAPDIVMKEFPFLDYLGITLLVKPLTHTPAVQDNSQTYSIPEILVSNLFASSTNGNHEVSGDSTLHPHAIVCPRSGFHRESHF
jgi:hypothetical protein